MISLITFIFVLMKKIMIDPLEKKINNRLINLNRAECKPVVTTENKTININTQC